MARRPASTKYGIAAVSNKPTRRSRRGTMLSKRAPLTLASAKRACMRLLVSADVTCASMRLGPSTRLGMGDSKPSASTAVASAAALTGKGSAMKPSIKRRPPMCTGANMKGSAMLARRACTTLPSRSTTRSPVAAQVVVTRRGKRKSSIRKSPKAWSRRCMIKRSSRKAKSAVNLPRRGHNI